MTNVRQTVAPAYLFLCIVLGGSAQGIFSNLALQLAGVGIIAWALLTRIPLKDSRPARQLGWLASAAATLVLLQLLPLPPVVWSHLPGRQFIVDGFRLLGQPLPWMPLSLAPADTIATAMAMVPPLAMLALILRLGAYRDSWLLIALLCATFISVRRTETSSVSPGMMRSTEGLISRMPEGSLEQEKKTSAPIAEGEDRNALSHTGPRAVRTTAGLDQPARPWSTLASSPVHFSGPNTPPILTKPLVSLRHVSRRGTSHVREHAVHLHRLPLVPHRRARSELRAHPQG